MRIPESERVAIKSVLEAAGHYGYGNLINHLVTAWAERLVATGMPEKKAREFAGRGGLDCGMPFQMQRDLLERGEWDETGARYREPVKTKRKPKKGRAR